MVRSDKASSGVGFTLEPESGFPDIVQISGVWGLGENIVQGTVTPDEFFVFKPTLLQGKNAIIQKKLGEKAKTMIYGNDENNPVDNIATPKEMQEQFVLNDEEVTKIANWALIIENHYQKPMDIEWAKDGITNEVFIIQARPETVHSQRNPLLVKEYKLLNIGESVTYSEAIGSKIAIGRARILQSPEESGQLQTGEIVISDFTSPDWDPVLKNAGAIITNKGGKNQPCFYCCQGIGRSGYCWLWRCN